MVILELFRIFEAIEAIEAVMENSDIDIVVEVEKPTLSLMHNLHEALSKLFNTKVDLVRFRKSLRPLLQSNINQEAVYV